MSKNKVTYLYKDNLQKYNYSCIKTTDEDTKETAIELHPMKPIRLDMTNELVKAFGLNTKMQMVELPLATEEEMKKFHDKNYVEFLMHYESIKNNADKSEFEIMEKNYGLDGGENGYFKGLEKFVSIYTGGSIMAAKMLNENKSDIVINWAGGLHHAKYSEASGFCHVNDIVLCIKELLISFKRVLYIDIDCHAGDGVQEAFVDTNRVLTASFHGFKEDFFPYCGSLDEIGKGAGKNYAINIPLMEGCSDDNYHVLFKPIISEIMAKYQPEAVVMQCGADSLGADPIGIINLSTKGHSKCVELIKTYNLPLILLGGGGYKVSAVSKCWTIETAIAVGVDIAELEIPYNQYYEFYAHNNKLMVKSEEEIEDKNDIKYLNETLVQIFNNLKKIDISPSI